MGKIDDDNLQRIVEYRRADRVGAAENYADSSRERLRKNIQTKIRTTMIGSLSIVEQKMGGFWGHGKARDQLSDREVAMEVLKDEMRTEILNLGNNQIRAIDAEMAQYDVRWNRYQYSVDASDPQVIEATRRMVGLNDDGTRKGPRHGTNPDGNVKTGPDEEGTE